MKHRNEIIADLIPAVAQGILATSGHQLASGWYAKEFADLVLDAAESLCDCGIARGIYEVAQ